MKKGKNESNAIIKRNPALLDIFTEQQIHCKNLAELDTPIGRCFDLLQTDLKQNSMSVVQKATPDLLSAVDMFLKGKKSPVKELLVANMDPISADIKEKIKKGIYKIGESKQVEGDVRAAIINVKSNKVVKQITLKKMESSGQPIADLNNLAVQAALKNIFQQLECIDAGIQYMIQFARRESLQIPYFDAMQKILDAKEAPTEQQRINDVEVAIKDLEHGLNGLYSDLSDNIKKIAEGVKWPVITQRRIKYIGEDMVFIPQYIALLSYLLNYSGRNQRAYQVLKFYQDELREFTTKPISQGRLTRAELVHTFCKYDTTSTNFWIDGITQIQQEMASVPIYKLENNESIFLLELEDDQDGRIH